MEDGQLVNDIYLGMSQPGGAGVLLSTGGDLVRWQMALTSGKVVKSETFAQMMTATALPNDGNTGYWHGLRIGEFEGQKRIGHGGRIFGFNSELLWLHEADLHIAVISNGESISSNAVAEAINFAVLDIQKAAVKDEPTTPELRARLAGLYHLEDDSMYARIIADGDRLMCQASDQEAFGLHWRGGDEFRAEFDGEVRIVFDPDATAFTLHQNGCMIRAQRLP